MTSLSELVEVPALTARLGYLVRPRTDPAVERVALIEDLNDLDRVAPRTIVLLTRGASKAAGSYRFDVALRRARVGQVSALVVSAPDVTRITPTSAAIANRSATAILGATGDTDLGDLAIALSREIAGAADVTLVRVHAAMRAIAAHPASGRPEAIVERAAAALGVPLTMAEVEPESGPRAPVVVSDHPGAWLTAPPQSGHLGLGVEIVLHLAARATAEALEASRRAEELPIQSRSEVLTELLAAPAQHHAPLVQRARGLGMPIDGWHVVVRVELEELTDAPAAGVLAGYRARQRLGRTMLQALSAGGGTWHSARAGLALIAVRTYPEDPALAAPAEIASGMDGAIDRMRSPTTLVRCGVGTAHAAAAGLVASAAEAKAAVSAARAAGRMNVAVPFDSLGLRRTLVEWYASDIAQDAVATVLAPLARLGGARSERLIQTLHVYLDHQGSLTKTAATLNLHRNAVAYRMNQVFSLLDVDPDNPDDLLLLQLACRARELA